MRHSLQNLLKVVDCFDRNPKIRGVSDKKRGISNLKIAVVATLPALTITQRSNMCKMMLTVPRIDSYIFTY